LVLDDMNGRPSWLETTEIKDVWMHQTYATHRQMWLNFLSSVSAAILS
jgi:hypothetical protein